MRSDPTLASSTPVLTVVVACIDARRTVAECLRSIATACEGLDVEIVVVDASSDGTAEVVRRVGVPVRLLENPGGTLAPALWAAGLATAHGQAVAFTIGHCRVGAGWAKGLLAGLESGATGAGGAIMLADGGTPVDWALFFLRYSAFLGAGEREVEEAHEIPGDNAAYRRDALQRHAASFSAGFWEVDFHRRIRAEGARLVFVPGAAARFGSVAPLFSLVQQRFSHGRHSGAWRIATGVRSSWQVIAAAPLVPFLLTLRIARRVLVRRAERVRFLISLPALFLLASAWAAGEAWGAVAATGPVMVHKPGLAV